jgi:hypothetical protein
MKLDSTGSDLLPICTMMNMLACDIIGFTELKLDVTKFAVKKILHETILIQFQSSKFVASTSEIPFQRFYKPGGTFTLVANESTCRYQTQYTDHLG